MKKRLIFVSAMLVLMISMAVTASAADSAYTEIYPIRMEEWNTYHFNISCELYDDWLYDETLDVNGFYHTDYTCEIALNGEEYYLGYGITDGSYPTEYLVYWDFDYTFDKWCENTQQMIEAKIYDGRHLIGSSTIYITVEPPAPYYEYTYVTDEVRSYAGQLTTYLNEIRSRYGLDALDTDFELDWVAAERLENAIDTQDFSHDMLWRSYYDNDIDFDTASEYFCVAQSTPEELLESLMEIEDFLNDLYCGNYNYIAVSALLDSDNNMNWVIEFYDGCGL